MKVQEKTLTYHTKEPTMTIYSGIVRDPVYLNDCDRIEPGTTFASWVEVSDCTAFTGFPDGTTFASWVEIIDCPAFTGFPDGTTFASWVRVINCPGFTGFPDGTTFASSVGVINCPAFTGFPDGTTFASWVRVINCPGFTGFPDGTTFASWVRVIDCPAFTGSRGCTFRGHAIAFGDEANERIRRIAAIVQAEPTRLEMSQWHCGTSHCLAGWGVHQEGDKGAALERELGETAYAGLVLLGLEAASRFYNADEEGEREVRDWLRSKLETSA
ncbi:hypothetical protein [Sphingomonas sp. HMP6]|uniref:hypothetical protein n=1 Tax=Sphingomonas sp. HMP6 TaxID=1517551 RepID=UPI00159668FB|nr:hypothetical protein [Sphingomonas sp. HMP6]